MINDDDTWALLAEALDDIPADLAVWFQTYRQVIEQPVVPTAWDVADAILATEPGTRLLAGREDADRWRDIALRLWPYARHAFGCALGLSHGPCDCGWEAVREVYLTAHIAALGGSDDH